MFIKRLLNSNPSYGNFNSLSKIITLRKNLMYQMKKTQMQLIKFYQKNKFYKMKK